MPNDSRAAVGAAATTARRIGANAGRGAISGLNRALNAFSANPRAAFDDWIGMNQLRGGYDRAASIWNAGADAANREIAGKALDKFKRANPNYIEIGRAHV